MLATTAQKFGSSGKSFQAPSAVAPTIGAALLASGTSDTADTAWSPSAACLLPDILPVAGTLLSYGGSRQLAAGGTVTHSVATASTKGMILKSTDDSVTQPLLEFQNSAGAMLHNITTNTATFANLSVTNVPSAPGWNCGATGYFQWGNRGLVRAAADGKFKFLNYAETAGVILDVTTDSTLKLRNRADSADANLTVDTLTSSGGGVYTPQVSHSVAGNYYLLNPTSFRLGSTTTIDWYSTTSILGTADIRHARSGVGQFDIRGDAGLRVRNFANSADANFTCAAITASGNVATTSGGLSCEVDPVNWRFRLSTSGTSRMDLDQFSLRLVDSAMILWSNTGNNVNATKLLGLCKNDTTNYLQINNGTEGTLNGLECGAITASKLGVTSTTGSSGCQLHDAAGAQSSGVQIDGTTTLIWRNNVAAFSTSSAGPCFWANNGLRFASSSYGGTPEVFIRSGGASVLAIRNNANSADADLTCAAITASGDIIAGTATDFISISASTSSVIGAYSNALGYHYQLIGDSTGGGGPMVFRIGAGGTIEWRSTNRADTGTTDLAFGRDSANVFGIYTDSTKATKAALTCGAITASGNLTLSDVNLITGTTTGTIIATANSQKLGFWGATPIVQPTTAVAAATLVSNGGTTLTDTDTFDGYTLKQIVKALRIAGFLA